MLSWENLSISLVNRNSAMKDRYFQALYPTSGHIERGQMLAILGESGSGKTTFISCLSGRIPSGSKTTGRILLDGKERELSSWAKECSLIEQSNTLIAELNLIENLTYVARFHGIKDNVREKAVQIARNLCLEHVMFTKAKSLSGGEIKRAAIAISLIVNPSIVLLDEPTSGLDTKNAYNLIKFLKRLSVESGKIIIVSLHQPGNRIINMFDKIMLITKSQVVYCDYLAKMFSFFEDFGFKIEDDVSIHENISDIIDQGSKYEEINSQKERLEQVAAYLKKSIKSEYTVHVKSNIFEINLVPCLKDIYYLTKRQFHVSYRGPGFYLRPIIQIAIFTFLFYFMKNIIPASHDLDNNMMSILKFSLLGMRDTISCNFLGFSSFRIFHPLFTEANYVEKEILCHYYTPCSYWIAFFIFLSSKMLVTNVMISAIFMSLSDTKYGSTHFWYFTLLPLTYIPYQLFLTFICKNTEISAGLAYIMAFLMQFSLTIQNFRLFSRNPMSSKLSILMFIDPQTFVIDIFQLIMSLNTPGMFLNSTIIFDFFELNLKNKSDKIRILLGGLLLNVLVMSMLSILLFSYWYMPTVRLKVGKRKK